MSGLAPPAPPSNCINHKRNFYQILNEPDIIIAMDRFRQNLHKYYEDELYPELSEFIIWLDKVLGSVLLALNQILDWFLSFNRDRAVLRWFIATTVAAGVWVSLALFAQDDMTISLEPDLAKVQIRYLTCLAKASVTSSDQPATLEERCLPSGIESTTELEPFFFELPFRLLFAPGIMRRIVLFGFAVWLAFKFAALYQAELFRLPDLSSAEHHILQAALINPRNTLHIQDGRVSQADQILPIFRLGGPGNVSVHLENAALFERVNGAPHVVGPSNSRDRRDKITGFEKLREVVDLRFQKIFIPINARTRDGIQVYIHDLQVVFNVYRYDEFRNADDSQPHQDPQAIENLVYKQYRLPWKEAVVEVVRNEFRDYLNRHSLDEILAILGEPESREGRKHAHHRAWSAHQGDEDEPFVYVFQQPAKIIEQVSQRAQTAFTRRGIQLIWMGIGAWDFPGEVFAKRHHKAWSITQMNYARSDPLVLEKLRNQQNLVESLELVRVVPLITYRGLVQQRATKRIIIRDLIVAYHQQMQIAQLDYLREEDDLEQKISQEENLVKRQSLKQRRLELEGERVQIERTLSFLSRFV